MIAVFPSRCDAKEKPLRGRPERQKGDPSMRDSTPKPHFKQVFNKGRVIVLNGWTERSGRRFQTSCSLPFAGANRWLERRVRKLVRDGSDIKTVSQFYARGCLSISRRGHARRSMQKAIAPAMRQTATAPVVARACVRESSGNHDGGGGGSDDSEDSDGSDGPDLPLLSPFGGRSLRNKSHKYQIIDLSISAVASLARWSR